jgi:ferredoxin hydrogenase gamma subunit
MQITINRQTVECQDAQSILETARQAGHYIPTLCELADINHTPGTCRVCLVEIKRKGQDAPIIVTSCNTPVEEGMEVLTRTPKVREMQRLQVELLLADHDQTCATCLRHGDCELQDVAQFVDLKQTRFSDHALARSRPVDRSSPAMVRDMSKCIRCFRCVTICRQEQAIDALVISGVGEMTLVGLRNGVDQANSDCVTCGQCIMVCPTGALAEKEEVETVLEYLADPDIKTVFQFAPAIRVGFGEEFGMPSGTNVEGLLIAALRKLGADVILDTTFAADLVIMEEANELISRLEAGKRPTFTSCCPSWVNFAEKHHPEILPYLSSTKSPQACLGAMAKTYLPKKSDLRAEEIRVISIMPCVAKKDEIVRPQATVEGMREVDVVLTIREFARLLRRENIDFKNLEPSTFDNPHMSAYSGAGVIFGTTGGVMEAALRTAYFILNGKELDTIEIEQLRGFDNIRTATVDMHNGVGPVKIAMCHGLKETRQIVEEVLAGTADYDFIEIMACPGGCVDGGGHLRSKKNYKPHAENRRQTLYSIDKKKNVRQSHKNQQVEELYRSFLGAPQSELAHRYLHTHYTNRRSLYQQTMRDIWLDVIEPFAR